jgi:ABC-type molybdenum transport system ATPase subunit/photorepair protein PhrA
MTTHRRDELIPAITNVLEIKHGRITRAETLTPTLSQRERESEGRFVPITNYKLREAQPFLINIVNASVALDEGAKVVLHKVTWRMNEGEHWMIVGDNGVGKSTLLKLILGDLWPAQGGEIERFGRSDFKNVWEIKQRIGYASAELQARYHHDLTAEQVIATGFSASVGWLQRTTKAQDKRVQAMIDLFGLRDLARRSILEMSYGQARKVLVARALVAQPRIVILDEVFDGLDAQFRAELTAILENIASPLPSMREGTGVGVNILLVTHHEADCLPCITHRMHIERGRLTYQERRMPAPLPHGEGLGVGR